MTDNNGRSRNTLNLFYAQGCLLAWCRHNMRVASIRPFVRSISIGVPDKNLFSWVHIISQSVSHSTPSPHHDWIPQSHTRLWPIWDWSHATAYTSNSQRRLLQPKCLGASPDSVWATSLHAPVVGGRYPWWPYRLRMLPANPQGVRVSSDIFRLPAQGFNIRSEEHTSE